MGHLPDQLCAGLLLLGLHPHRAAGRPFGRAYWRTSRLWTFHAVGQPADPDHAAGGAHQLRGAHCGASGAGLHAGRLLASHSPGGRCLDSAHGALQVHVQYDG